MAEALNVAERLEAPLARVCRVAGVSRSAACEQRRRRSSSEPTAPRARRRPGPVGAMPDHELLAAIRREIADVAVRRRGPQEDHRPAAAARDLHEPQARAAVDARGRAARARRRRCASAAGACTTGRITTDTPDELWATDPTEAWTRQDGRCAVFAIVDHCTGEAWVDAAAADGPLRRRRPAARGDHRPLRLGRGRRRRRPEAAPRRRLVLPLGALPGRDRPPRHRPLSPAFHYEPETNGVVEKFIQTLKEQVLWIERFDTLEQLRARIRAVRRGLQRALAARTPRLPHPTPGARSAPSGRRGMIAAFTNEVSGEPGAAPGPRIQASLTGVLAAHSGVPGRPRTPTRNRLTGTKAKIGVTGDAPNHPPDFKTPEGARSRSEKSKQQ